MIKKESKFIIGWQELISLPDINIPAIRAKIDTGAKTSSLHAENIQYFKEEGKDYVSFRVHPIQKNRKIIVKCQALLIDKRNVKSSNGIEENRPLIKTKIKIGNHLFQIDLNLTKRDSMGFRMLLGRDAMKNRIIIDPQYKYLSGNLLSSEIESQY
jgi:ribosomal protein S6--L-glutamate ligase